MSLKFLKYGAAAALTAGLLLGTMTTAFAAHLEDIAARGTIRVGTTGDYRPMSYKDKETGKYEGFDAELAEKLAASLHVKVEYVPTTWKTLSQDTKDGKFDLALCGITRTFDRERTLTMSDGYLLFGKTILCRKGDAAKFKTLADLNKPGVRVMVNPGGTNEKFARANHHDHGNHGSPQIRETQRKTGRAPRGQALHQEPLRRPHGQRRPGFPELRELLPRRNGNQRHHGPAGRPVHQIICTRCNSFATPAKNLRGKA